MLPPLFLMLHGAGGTGGRGTLLQDPTIFGAILYAELFFFKAAFVLFLCSMGRFPSISMSLPPSPCLPCCCRHVCFLMLTGFSLVRAVSPFMPSVSFFASLSFSYAAPASSYVPRRRWDGARGTLVQDPTFFGAILYAELFFFNAAFVLFLCFMGRFPSISMSLPPFPCLHPVVDFFFGRRTLLFYAAPVLKLADSAFGSSQGSL